MISKLRSPVHWGGGNERLQGAARGLFLVENVPFPFLLVCIIRNIFFSRIIFIIPIMHFLCHLKNCVVVNLYPNEFKSLGMTVLDNIFHTSVHQALLANSTISLAFHSLFLFASSLSRSSSDSKVHGSAKHSKSGGAHVFSSTLSKK